MNPEQLFLHITSELKWYAGYCRHNTASMIKKRFKNRTLSYEKLTHLFKHFGYTKIKEEEWQKSN